MGDGCAVIARNFPAAWVASSALPQLPSKVQSLLHRIGTLIAPPVVGQGSRGLEAVARFQTPEAAADAVRTLHGTDLRTNAEKRAVGFQAPKDSERFWLQLVSAEAALAATMAVAPAAAPQARRLRPGVYLSPLPPSWAENDVLLLASPYGSVSGVRMAAAKGNEQRGAYIDFQSIAAAQGALSGLDGLTLMGVRLRCVMQEEPEPAKPTLSFLIYIDELAMPSRPEVEPRLNDRELFLPQLSSDVRSEEAVRSWMAMHGDVEEVFLLRDRMLALTGRAYVRFRSNVEAVKALKSLRDAGGAGASAVWSESERALAGCKSSYGVDVLRRICGAKDSRLAEIRQAVRASGLEVGGASMGEQRQTAAPQVHFVVRCEHQGQVDECRALLSKGLALAHGASVRDPQGTLVLSGFPPSWSEKGLKFIFAPFGGLASVVLEEAPAGKADSAPSRLAVVRLRNPASTNKAVSSLHRTNVGDGDLVEECVVECQRWHVRAWSDASFRVSIFIDQLAMMRRPLGASPGPEDRELFVRNLPLQDMNRQQLQEYFEGFGVVEDLRLILDPFTGEPVGEGYVRFAHHRDARHCMEALTPDQEAEAADLVGSWSESERVLQRKGNCYGFNLISELVGENGAGLERLKTEAKLNGIWLLAESLKQKDVEAPGPDGKQVHFVGRVTEEAHVQLFRELLEKSLEEAHARITDRLERRKRKAQSAATLDDSERRAAAGRAAAGAAVGAASPMPTAAPTTMPQSLPTPSAASATTDTSAASPWSAPPRNDYWGSGGATAWTAPPSASAPMPQYPPHYGASYMPGYPPPAPWGHPHAAMYGADARNGAEERGRRHRHRSSGGGREGDNDERKDDHKHHRRRHRRERSAGRAGAGGGS
eukprot:TRINITY_DN73513_c0_g1_i1.p1 TRINITY_DN73513_c0_g1~~TRINITY_DN73513_c0_g1_i1.p1  ORF type:complete len:893 (-),score=143.39 TRINITY_DN73513_c0_g1_i1:151-2787(-)